MAGRRQQPTVSRTGTPTARTGARRSAATAVRLRRALTVLVAGVVVTTGGTSAAAGAGAAASARRAASGDVNGAGVVDLAGSGRNVRAPRSGVDATGRGPQSAGQPAGAAAGPAVVVVVRSLGDDVDAVPGDGRCSTATGACTVRAAFDEATAAAAAAGAGSPPPVEVVLPPGRIELAAPLVVSAAVTVRGGDGAVGVGAGAGAGVDAGVDGASTVLAPLAGVRAFEVTATGTLEVLGAVTIDGGRTARPAPLATPGDGGCLEVRGRARLVDTVVTGCWAAASGGAVMVRAGGELELAASEHGAGVVLTGNRAATGGALAVDGATATATGAVRFEGNEADGDGGAVVVLGAGRFELQHRSAERGSLLRDNHAGGDGGAIAVARAATATLTGPGVQLSGNRAVRDGGAIATSGRVVLERVRLGGWDATEANRAGRDGGALHVGGADGVGGTAGHATLREVAIAFAAAGADGGGLAAVARATVSITRSSITDSVAGGRGGGVALRDAAVAGTQVSIVDNEAPSAPAVVSTRSRLDADFLTLAGPAERDPSVPTTTPIGVLDDATDAWFLAHAIVAGPLHCAATAPTRIALRRASAFEPSTGCELVLPDGAVATSAPAVELLPARSVGNGTRGRAPARPAPAVLAPGEVCPFVDQGGALRRRCDLGALEGPPTSGPVEVGGISGAVVDADTGRALPGMCVSARGRSTWVETVTGDDGRYRFDGLPAGDYSVVTLDCQGLRYATAWYPAASRQVGATPVAVAVGADTVGIDVAVRVGATVRGTVVEQPSGTPLCAEALLFDATGVLTASVRTELDGTYRLPASSGTWYLAFDACDLTRELQREWFGDRPFVAAPPDPAGEHAAPLLVTATERIPIEDVVLVADAALGTSVVGAGPQRAVLGLDVAARAWGTAGSPPRRPSSPVSGPGTAAVPVPDPSPDPSLDPSPGRVTASAPDPAADVASVDLGGRFGLDAVGAVGEVPVGIELVVANTGTDPVPAVVVEGTLPDGAEPLGLPRSCSRPEARRLVCTVALVAPAATVALRIDLATVGVAPGATTTWVARPVVPVPGGAPVGAAPVVAVVIGGLGGRGSAG